MGFGFDLFPDPPRGIAVADLRGSEEPLRAVDVLDPAAEPVAVPEAAYGAAGAPGGAVAADLRQTAFLPADALVGPSVAPFEGLAGVLPDLPRDARHVHVDRPGDGFPRFSFSEPGFDAATLRAVEVCLPFRHRVPFLCAAELPRWRIEYRKARIVRRNAGRGKGEVVPAT